MYVTALEVGAGSVQKISGAGSDSKAAERLQNPAYRGSGELSAEL